MGRTKKHHHTSKVRERNSMETVGWNSGPQIGDMVARNSAFRCLALAKFEEEMSSQLAELTAQQFLDCAYGNELQVVSARKAHSAAQAQEKIGCVPSSLSSSMPCSNSLLSEGPEWDWSNVKKYGTTPRGTYGSTTF
jgi:hypothetical protein